MAAGVGSLSGELHGGANTRVMEMLLDIGSVEKVEGYVNNLLDTGGIIMGLGHAVYKTDDPRAHILAVITSYSIHYTKLYETLGNTACSHGKVMNHTLTSRLSSLTISDCLRFEF